MSTRWFRWIGIAGVLLLGLLAFAPAALAEDAKWRAAYFNNNELRGNPRVERDENEINYNWGEREPAVEGLRLDDWSARWTRKIYFPKSGIYRFNAIVDDGVRVFVDDRLVVDAWTVGPARNVSGETYLNQGDHKVRVEYFDGVLGAQLKFWWEFVSNQAPPPGAIFNWRGEYFNNQSLAGGPVAVRDDAQINFDWGTGAPIAGVGTDNFSVRWTRTINFNAGRYRFTTTTDDGVRLWVNNQLIIDKWFPQAVTAHSGEIVLPSGPATIRMEYFEQGHDAVAKLNWTQVGPSSAPGGGTGGVATATVTVAKLNVRQGPSTSFPIVTQLSQGNIVLLAGYRNAAGTWILIDLPNGIRGWSYAPLLQTTYPIMSLAVYTDQPAPPPTGAFGSVANAAHLNVRSGPGVGNSIVTTVSFGTELQLVGRNGDAGWLRVVLPNGVQGWVRATYVNTTFPVMNLPVVG